MEGKRKAEVAIQLLLTQVIAKDGFKLKKRSLMEDQAKKVAREIGVRQVVFSLFMEALIRYVVDKAFTDDDQVLQAQFEQLVLLGMEDDVAYKGLKRHLKKEGIHLRDNSLRSLGQIAQETEIDTEELKKFFKMMIHDMAEEILKEKV